MKKIITLILAVVCVMGLAGCSQWNREPAILKTYKETPVELMVEYLDNSKPITTTKYYEMSDGTWKTDIYTYKYRVEVKGRLKSAEKDSSYVILSNTDKIIFEQAWKASGLSGDANEYFKVKDAVIVGMSFGD